MSSLQNVLVAYSMHSFGHGIYSLHKAPYFISPGSCLLTSKDYGAVLFQGRMYWSAMEV